MTLFEKLNTDRLESRKSGDKLKASLLGTIIGEASKKDKNPDDNSVFATLSKFKNSAEEMLKHVQTDDARKELEIIESYIPQPMLDDEIRFYVNRISLDSNVEVSLKNMKIFKETFQDMFPGRVSGADLSSVIKNW